MKRRSVLKASVLAMLSANVFFGGVVLSSAADYTMNEVIVEGQRDRDEVGTLPGGFMKETSATGLLGETNVMETPFTVSTISQKTIKHFAAPYNGISDALALDPSVRADRGGTYTDVSIRGIYQSGHSFYVNGIPGLMDQQNIPYYWVDNVTVISGPNLGVNGSPLSEAASGVVNMQSKRAEENPNTNLLLSYRGGSSFEQGVDVGRRFGDNSRYGVRVTANNIQGETTIENEKVTQRNLFVNLDQHTDNSKTNFLIGYNYVDHQGGPGSISFSSGSTNSHPDWKPVTVLPSAPDASKLYKPSWAYNEYDNWIMALNHEQKISEHATAYVNAGYHREDWYGYIDGNPTVLDNQGNFYISMTNYPLALTRKYVGVGVKGDFNIGSIKNNYLVGVDKNWMTYALGKNANFANKGTWEGTGNLYGDNSWANPGITHYNPPHTQDTQLAGWHIVDTMKMLDDKLQITLGVHGHQAKLYKVGEKVQKSDAISPTYAVSYRINPELTIYADHTESFGMGSMVSIDSKDGYANAGEILDPTKTKQNEVGVKFKIGNFLNTLSYFQIKQANLTNKTINGLLYRVIDGEQTNKGFEWAFTGQLAKKWDLVGGVMYLNAKDKNGRDVSGASDWSATIGAMYHVNDTFSILGRMTYLDSTTINSGKLQVPSYMKWDLGISYKTKINNTPVTFDAMCYNIFGKDYWTARSGYDSLSLGAPRTFVLSANFQL